MQTLFQIIDLRDRMAQNQAEWEREADYEQDLLDYQAREGDFADAEVNGSHLPDIGEDQGVDFQVQAR